MKWGCHRGTLNCSVSSHPCSPNRANQRNAPSRSPSRVQCQRRTSDGVMHTSDVARICMAYAGRWRGVIEQSIPTLLFPSSASQRQVKQRSQRSTGALSCPSCCSRQARVSRRSAPGTPGSLSETGVACGDREHALPPRSINKSILMPDPIDPMIGHSVRFLFQRVVTRANAELGL